MDGTGEWGRGKIDGTGMGWGNVGAGWMRPGGGGEGRGQSKIPTLIPEKVGNFS